MIRISQLTTTGTFVRRLPQWVSVQFMDELNREGSGSIVFPKNGVGVRALSDSSDGVLWIEESGFEPFGLFFDAETENLAEEGGELSVSGQGLQFLLTRGLVWPRDGVGAAPEYDFDATTAGGIMKTLIQRAKDRGAIPGVLTNTFTSSVDSAGQPWGQTLDITPKATQNLMDVMQDMCDNGWCDARMNGFELELYKPDTALNRDKTNVVIRLAREVTDAPRSKQRSKRANVALVVGDGGINIEVIDSTKLPSDERIEVPVEDGRLSLNSTMRIYGENQLKESRFPAEGYTIAVDLNASPWQPRRDFRVGDNVFADFLRNPTTRAYIPQRVSSVAMSFGANGERECSIELADVFLTAQQRLKKRIDGITSGVDNPAPAASSVDRTVPKAPSSVAIYATNYRTPDGTYLGHITVTWPAVTTNNNTENSLYDDQGDYAVGYKINGNDWSGDVAVSPTGPMVAYFDNIPIGSTVQARVRAIDSNGHSSAYAYSPTNPAVVIPQDTEGPPRPSVPVVTTYFRGVRISWDGTFLNSDNSPGAVRPGDFSHVNVHMSTTTPVLTTAATLVDQFRVQTRALQPDLVPGTTYYVKFVAYDTTGNATEQPVEQSATAALVIDDDVEAVSVEKLETGTLSADILMAGRLRTSDGVPRVEISNEGIVQYDYAADGITPVRSVEILSDGTARFTGTITGSVFQTSAGSSNVLRINDDGLKLYDMNGSVSVALSTSSGEGEFTGVLNATSVTVGNPTGTTYVTNFDDSAAGGMPLNWRNRLGSTSTTVNYSTISVLNEANSTTLRFARIIRDTANAYGEAYYYPVASSLYTNGEVTGTARIGSAMTLPSDAIVLATARTSKSNYPYNNTYMFSYYNDFDFGGARLTLTKIVGGTTTHLATRVNALFSMTVGVDYKYRFRMVGALLQGKIWLSTSPEPTDWTLQAVDRDIQEAGFWGLGSTGNTFWGKAQFITEFRNFTVRPIAGSLNIDPAGNMWIGDARMDTAPFSVSKDGVTISDRFATAATGRRIQIGSYWNNDVDSATIQWNSSASYAFQPLIAMGTNLARNGDGLTIQSGQISGRMDSYGIMSITLDQVNGIMLGAGRVPGSTDTRASRITLDPGTGGIIDGRTGGTQFSGFYFDTNEYAASHVMLGRGPLYLRDGTDINHSIQYEVVSNVADGTMFKAYATWRWYAAQSGLITATLDRFGNLQNAGWLGRPSGSDTGRAPVFLTRGGGDEVHFDVLSGRFEVYVNGSRNFSFGASLGKTFVIDHPDDKDRHLIHAVVEGPENAVFYRGIADIVDFQAVVELPSYFESLTYTDGRTVQLTPVIKSLYSNPYAVGSTTPSDGKFVIISAQEQGRVAWEVKAVRKDVARVNVEPYKRDVNVSGFGPYKFYEERTA